LRGSTCFPRRESEICTKPAITISAKASIAEASRLMRAKNIGAIVVANTGKPQGILRDRDIAVSVVAAGTEPATVTVGEVMRKQPSVIREDAGVFDAVKMFGAKGIRRLPVVSRKGKLMGMIALDDVLMLLGREMSHVAAGLSRELGRARRL
jgi:signal-transduction protein with cAMP-binding, CBS, and nucleotidyltransferase domain